MIDKDTLNRALAAYTHLLVGDYEIGDALYRLTDEVVQVLDVAGAGVSIADDDGRLQFVTATDDEVVRLEERQIALGEGPCHTAFTEGRRVTCPDLRATGEWPDYVATALDGGWGAVAGIPMVVDEIRIGALNLYRYEAGPWSDDHLEAAQLLADMATGYIVNVRDLTQSRRLNAQLQHALDSRVIIEQAKGIVAERHGIDLPKAFELLRGYARNHNEKLHDVADRVVDDSLRL